MPFLVADVPFPSVAVPFLTALVWQVVPFLPSIISAISAVVPFPAAFVPFLPPILAAISVSPTT